MRKLFLLAIVIILTSNVFASLPVVKTYDKQKNLLEGEAEKISISSKGILSLSPQVKKIFDSNQPFIWDLAVDLKGNLFVAAGDGAKILRMTSKGKVDSIAHWSDSEVYALAIDKKGFLYAAVSPEGKIYRFDKKFKPQLYAELNVKYVWDLVFDSNNICYAATGDSGSIYQVKSTGKTSLFFKSDETHIRCLTWDKQKNLLAGSYKNGYIYRIDAYGKGTIVYDSDFEEISQIQVTPEGTIYALGMSSSKKLSLPVKDLQKSSDLKSSLKPEDIIKIMAAPTGKKTGITSGILKIQPNGLIKNIWTERGDDVHSICLVKDGLLAGTGEKGRLYKLNEDDESTLLLKLTESQILTLIPQPSGEVWLAASNLAAVYQLGKNYEKSGTYVSPVIDAASKTRWGTVQWEEKLTAGDKVQFYTRTGNTKQPDTMWDPWQKIDGDNQHGTIKSPDARFLQWKLELKSKKDQSNLEIEKIKISYLQQNLPPEITSITVHPHQRKTTYAVSAPLFSDFVLPSISVKSSLESQLSTQTIRPEPYRRPLTNGYRRVSWRATDKNKDQLTYALHFRFENDTNWLLLKKDLTRSTYTWDSRSMPDDIYQLKVTARDEKFNPLNTALKAEKKSDWFVVDNTGPKIKNISVNKSGSDSLYVSFSVSDELSVIKKVQFSLNVQKWMWVYPEDLVCDTKQEKFNFRIKLPDKNFRVIVVKATDEADNTGYSRFIIEE